jgi:hypothetical protein
MHRMLMALAAAGLASALGGCGLYQDVQAISRDLSKNESNADDVGSGAPLTIPPDASLRPPATGSTPQSGEGTARRAQVILRTTEDVSTARAADPGRGARAREAGPTAGERELLTRSGYTGGTSDVVRRTVEVERERRTAGQRDFTDRVLKYDPKAKPRDEEDGKARDATGDKPVIKRPGEL